MVRSTAVFVRAAISVRPNSGLAGPIRNRVFVIANFLMPELKSRSAKTDSYNGEVPPGQRNVGARGIHVHQPDLAAATEPESPRFVLQFAFAGLYPKQVRARFLKPIMPVRLFYPPRAD